MAMPHLRDTRLFRYSASVALLGIATLLRFWLNPILGDEALFPTYFGAMLVAAWLLGLGPALLVLCGGAIVTAWLLIPAPNAGALPPEGPWLGVVLWVGFSLFLLVLFENIRRNRYKAETAERHFRRLLEAGNVGMALVDQHGGIQDANPAFLNLLGYTLDEVRSGELRWDRITPPEFAHVTEQVIRTVEETGAEALPYAPYEKEYIAKDGRRIPVLVSLVPFERLPDGTGIGAITVVDLSMIKAAEKQLRESEARFREVVESVPDVIYRAAVPSFHAQYISPAVESLLGFTPEEWYAEPELWERQLHADDRARVLKETETGLATAENAILRYRLWHKDGRTLHWVEDRVHVERDVDGNPMAIFGTLLDITERMRAEEALRRANAELQQFAYVASHDLKAPLRAVSHLSTWLEEDLGPQLDGDNRHNLQLLRERVCHMDALIEGLLAYSRAGGETREVETVDSEQLVREMLNSHAIPAGVQVLIADEMPQLVTDRVKLGQVVDNLIGNALKYNRRPDGHIWVSAADAGNYYEFSVADDGPGIPPEFHDRIFQILQRGPAAQEQEGTGMGLAIVKKLVEGMGGRISVESQPGQGSTFRFTWPKVMEIRPGGSA